MNWKAFLLVFVMSCVILQVANVVNADDLIIKSGTVIMLSQAEEVDKNLWKSGKMKAEEMGYNPICLSANKQGSISFGKGTKLRIENNKHVFSDDDMIINAGKNPAEINGVKLNKGEFGVVKNGKIEKQTGTITNKFGSERVYSVYLVTNQGPELLSKAEKVIRDCGYQMVETSTKLNKDSEGLVIHYAEDAEVQAREISQLLKTKLGAVPVIKKWSCSQMRTL